MGWSSIVRCEFAKSILNRNYVTVGTGQIMSIYLSSVTIHVIETGTSTH